MAKAATIAITASLTAMRGLLVYFTRCRRVPTELELAAAQEELDTFLDARLGGC